MPPKPPPPDSDFLRGTLDLLVLRTLERGPLHGYAVARDIEQASGGELAIEEGSLYPALHRLEKRAFIAGEWVRTDQNRRARIYQLTPRGRRRLADQVSLWSRLSGAVSRVLDAGTGAPDGPIAPRPQERPA